MKKKFQNQSFLTFLSLSFCLHLFVGGAFIFSKDLFFKNQEKSLLIENSIQIDQIALPNLKSSKNTKKPAKNKKNEKTTVKQTTAKKNEKTTAKQTTAKKNEKTTAKQTTAKKNEKTTAKQTTAKKNEKTIVKQTIAKKNEKTTAKQTTAKKNEKTIVKQTIAKKNEKMEELEKENKEASKSKNSNNKLSKDNRSGDSALSPQQFSEINLYTQQILNQFRKGWNLPVHLKHKSLTAQVEIKIDLKGEIIYKEIFAPSGDGNYDNFVLNRIETAGPYPKPSKSIQKIIQQYGGGIVLIVPNSN